ncbi:MAG: hypothetical protein AAF719_10185 [Pseudomonadota bacterium]
MVAFTVLAIFVGGLISAGIVVAAVRFAAMSPENVQRGELSMICGTAMNASGVRDTGGCKCAADAAVKDGKLNARRRVELRRYYRAIAENPDILNGQAPTATGISRNIGLVYGHPFVRAYRACYRDGFVNAEDR